MSKHSSMVNKSMPADDPVRRVFRPLVAMVETLADAELATAFTTTTTDQSRLADPFRLEAA